MIKKKVKKKIAKPEFEFHQIDKSVLDDEWVSQLGMVRHYGYELAEAKREMEEAKTAVELLNANLSLRIRTRPRKYGLTKVTEAAIKDAIAVEVLTSEEHANLLKAKDKVNVVAVATNTLEHRKKALEDIVYLTGIGYTGEPRAKKGTRQDVEDMKENRNNRMLRERLKKG